MVSSIDLVVAALSTAHEIGLAVVAGLFIAFALISSFLLPRGNPNFPGRHIGWYATVCVLFFVAMLSAVLVLGRESSAEPSGREAATTTAAGTTTPGSTTPATTTQGGGAAAGNSTAGKQVFLTAGCKDCHTLKDAGAT